MAAPITPTYEFLSTLSLRRATGLVIMVGFITCISIHALLAESDRGIFTAFYMDCQFLSTLSLRRATNKRCEFGRDNGNFYPRSPCGERPAEPETTPSEYVISIHALLAESDTELLAACTAIASISIHALLAESDLGQFHWFLLVDYFYPRSPCGERRVFPDP